MTEQLSSQLTDYKLPIKSKFKTVIKENKQSKNLFINTTDSDNTIGNFYNNKNNEHIEKAKIKKNIVEINSEASTLRTHNKYKDSDRYNVNTESIQHLQHLFVNNANFGKIEIILKRLVSKLLSETNLVIMQLCNTNSKVNNSLDKLKDANLPNILNKIKIDFNEANIVNYTNEIINVFVPSLQCSSYRENSSLRNADNSPNKYQTPKNYETKSIFDNINKVKSPNRIIKKIKIANKSTEIPNFCNTTSNFNSNFYNEVLNTNTSKPSSLKSKIMSKDSCTIYPYTPQVPQKKSSKFLSKECYIQDNNDGRCTKVKNSINLNFIFNNNSPVSISPIQNLSSNRNSTSEPKSKRLDELIKSKNIKIKSRKNTDKESFSLNSDALNFLISKLQNSNLIKNSNENPNSINKTEKINSDKINAKKTNLENNCDFTNYNKNIKNIKNTNSYDKNVINSSYHYENLKTESSVLNNKNNLKKSHNLDNVKSNSIVNIKNKLFNKAITMKLISKAKSKVNNSSANENLNLFEKSSSHINEDNKVKFFSTSNYINHSTKTSIIKENVKRNIKSSILESKLELIELTDDLNNEKCCNVSIMNIQSREDDKLVFEPKKTSGVDKLNNSKLNYENTYNCNDKNSDNYNIESAPEYEFDYKNEKNLIDKLKLKNNTSLNFDNSINTSNSQCNREIISKIKSELDVNHLNYLGFSYNEFYQPSKYQTINSQQTEQQDKSII